MVKISFPSIEDILFELDPSQRKEHEGKLIAVGGGRIVGSGRTYRELHDDVQRNNYSGLYAIHNLGVKEVGGPFEGEINSPIFGEDSLRDD